jgi:hypothetical protein
MGMDVYGNNPTDESGRYFRNNMGCWGYLAAYCCKVAPEITSTCEYWFSNDGDGLDADRSLRLADRLQAEIDSGRTLEQEKRFTGEEAASLCNVCAGTGTRKPATEIGGGEIATGVKCKKCNGTGFVRPPHVLTAFTVENVQDFVEFLRACGGFQIW